MDEIEYKLNTNNSVVVVNAIDKLISAIRSKFKPAERQKFVLENEELKLLRDKCSAKEAIVSLTACQGLLALVELGVLEIAHTMSTVVTLLPTAQNYSAIISTMTGLLILDLKSRLVPEEPYKCQFSVKSPQHPFITVLERNKNAEDDVFAQMQALCTHPDYTVSSNSLELLRSVFFYLTCNPLRECSIRPWQLLLSLPKTDAQRSLLLACLSCQQICSRPLIERAFSAYSAVTDAAIYQQDEEYVIALLPMLARISNELVKNGRDPRPCYHLMERCFALDAARLRAVTGVTLLLLSANLSRTSALYLHDTFNLCFNIISKYACPSIALNAFVAQSLQWLHQPSYLTTSALKVASKILDTYQSNTKEDTTLNIPNLMSNKIFESLLHTDSQLSVTVKLLSVWERLRDDETKLKAWLDGIECIHDLIKIDLLPFLYGVVMSKDRHLEGVVLKVLKLVVNLVDFKKELAVEILPVLVYKISNDISPAVRYKCLRMLPLMAKTRENVPAVIALLNKLKVNKGVPLSVLIMLYTSLVETYVRCFPYLQEVMVEQGIGGPDDLKWEVDIARILAVKKMCEMKSSSPGLDLVPLVSATLNQCRDRAGVIATCLALQSVALLWRAGSLEPMSTWRALEANLARDDRPYVQIDVCRLLGEVPALSASAQYPRLAALACGWLWRALAGGGAGAAPVVVGAACCALANFGIEHYVLKDIPEIYRKTVKLPASYCKTPTDAARKPEEVLEYIPCEVWPEVFKYTTQVALSGVVVLVRKLIEREVKTYRSGVYHVEGCEPPSLAHLPPHSVVRGVADYFRKRVASPSYECPDVVTLAMLVTLSGEFPKPLPPHALFFLTEGCAKGGEWRRLSLTYAARQLKVSNSAQGIIDSWLRNFQMDYAAEPDILLFYELLPTLICSLSPNTLLTPLTRTLGAAFILISQTKAKEDYTITVLKQITKNPSKEASQEVRLEETGESLFELMLKQIKKCLDCELIPDANRTLLSQLVEEYFGMLTEDNVAWPAYVQTCRSLPAASLQRMTAPSYWRGAARGGGRGALRRAAALRAARAGGARGDGLMWLNEIIDASAEETADQEASLCYMFPALVAAAPSTLATQKWFMQLMARTQVEFYGTQDLSVKLYLFTVFVLSVVAWSGHWALEDDVGALLSPPAPAPAALARMPSAAAALLAHFDSEGYMQLMLEWLWHTRDTLGAAGAASGAKAGAAAEAGAVAVAGVVACCQRSLVALRHTNQFATHKIWTKLESHFGKDIVNEV